MKRFYCTVCRQVRRVRNWPTILSKPNEVSPGKREGKCDWHSGVPRVKRIPKKVFTSKPKTPPKQQQGKKRR